jgi:hypothetical protein
MRTLTTTLALTLATVLATRASAAGPVCDDGQFALRGAGIDLGGTAGRVDVINVIGVDGSNGARSFVVRLGQACQASVVTQAPRTDAFVLRTRFVGCGARPRFRLRLFFHADCATTDVTMRAAGQVVGTFAADRTNPDVTDPTPSPTDPTVTDPSPNDPTTTPPSSGPSTVVTDTPSITSFAPLAASHGQTISIFGTALDHDANGHAFTGTPPYLVTFQSVDPSFGRLRATPTLVSRNEITVTVPSTAVSGTLVLAVRQASGLAGATISETTERLVVTSPAPPAQSIPQAGTAPATANKGTLHVLASGLSLFNAGDFSATGGANQIGAFFDANANHVVDLFTTGRDDVPYLAFPVRTSEFDFSIEGGRGYFAGANAMLWVFFEGGDPAVLDNRDQFFVVHLAIDLAHRTAKPIAMLAGVAGDPGVVMMADQFASETQIAVEQPGAGVGAIHGTIAAVPQFLQLIFDPSQPQVGIDPGLGFFADPGTSFEQRLWANGITIDFDVPLFADSQS